jgi:hypothetical protein
VWEEKVCATPRGIMGTSHCSSPLYESCLSEKCVGVHAKLHAGLAWDASSLQGFSTGFWHGFRTQTGGRVVHGLTLQDWTRPCTGVSVVLMMVHHQHIPLSRRVVAFVHFFSWSMHTCRQQSPPCSVDESVLEATPPGSPDTKKARLQPFVESLVGRNESCPDSCIPC